MKIYDSTYKPFNCFPFLKKKENIITDPSYSVAFRLNVGGSLIIATDGNMDWLPNVGSGSESGTGWTCNAGSPYDQSYVSWTKGATIPASLPTVDHDSIYDSQKWGDSSDGPMTYTFTSLSNGIYKVRVYTGEESPPNTFNINVQSLGNVSVNPNVDFGTLVTGVYEFLDIVVSSGTLTVQFNSPLTYYFVNGLEILIKN
jgi:hypothetical protein